MKKVLSLTLVTLAVAALSAPAFAHCNSGVYIEGGLGYLSNQAVGPVVSVRSAAAAASTAFTYDNQYTYTGRSTDDWYGKVGGRWCMGCAPCNTYLDVDYRWVDNTTTTTFVSVTEGATSPVWFRDVSNANGLRYGTANSTIGTNGLIILNTGASVVSSIAVQNKFEQGQVGWGIDLCTCCKPFTLSFGAGISGFKAEQNIAETYVGTGVTTAAPFSTINGISTAASGTGVANVVTVHYDNAHEATGYGLNASVKGAYKFCICDSSLTAYVKTTLSDFYTKHDQSARLYYQDHAAAFTATSPGLDVSYLAHADTTYNNVFDIEIETGLTYKPCWKCVNLDFTLGFTAKSTLNVFECAFNDSASTSLAQFAPFLRIGASF